MSITHQSAPHGAFVACGQVSDLACVWTCCDAGRGCRGGGNARYGVTCIAVSAHAPTASVAKGQERSSGIILMAKCLFVTPWRRLSLRGRVLDGRARQSISPVGPRMRVPRSPRVVRFRAIQNTPALGLERMRQLRGKKATHPPVKGLNL